jgi:hypothetical protein
MMHYTRHLGWEVGLAFVIAWVIRGSLGWEGGLALVI